MAVDKDRNRAEEERERKEAELREIERRQKAQQMLTSYYCSTHGIYYPKGGKCPKC